MLSGCRGNATERTEISPANSELLIRLSSARRVGPGAYANRKQPGGEKQKKETQREGRQRKKIATTRVKRRLSEFLIADLQVPGSTTADTRICEK
jgi:hypothetical protein